MSWQSLHTEGCLRSFWVVVGIGETRTEVPHRDIQVYSSDRPCINPTRFEAATPPLYQGIRKWSNEIMYVDSV